MADPIKAVFLTALETKPEQRPAYLDQACGSDAEVRRRVEALLRAHEGPDWLLDQPAWRPTPEQHVTAAAATVLLHQSLTPERDVAGSAPAAGPTARAGRVQLLGEIARGGMGVVLRGHDPELGRELAVKVILPAHRDNPDSVRRFVSEARLAGQLQHPGIVPVHDVGRLADGRPFFTMKLIQGRTLAELLAERPDPGHELPRFLRYFEAVCQAVGYAHAHGVIHRDLKPDNVMVGAFGEVQVMDWGLAKRLGDGPDEGPEPAPYPPVPRSSTPVPAALTQPGAVVGTPGYLAPEQARGRSGDQRADVFGLGAILCEVLTGEPPFRRGSPLDLVYQAREGNLGDATDALDRSGADPELVRLAKDCLAVDAAGRPADGAAVAARVAEYLAGVQERLRRAEVGQARALARAEGERTRRRLAVGLAVAVLAVVALGGGTLLLVQRRHTEQAREQALRRQAGESALSRAADLRAQGRWAEALAVLEQARQRLDERDESLAGQVREAVKELELIARLDGIRLGAATWTGRSFAREQADRDYESEFRAAGLGGPDEPAEVVAARVRASGARAALVAALDDWAARTTDRDRRAWARAVAGTADTDEWGRRLRADWQDAEALRRLVREAPIDRLSPHLLSMLGWDLGGSESVSFLRKAQKQYPGDFWLNFLLARRLMDEQQYAEAEGFYRAALAARPGTKAVLLNLGVALRSQRQLDEACDYYRQALALDPGFAFAHSNLGAALNEKGDLDGAAACFRTALAIDPEDPVTHLNLGIVLRRQGEFAEAVASLRKAIDLGAQGTPVWEQLAGAAQGQGKPDEAIACYNKLIELAPDVATFRHNLGMMLASQGDAGGAIASYRKAIELDPRLAAAHVNLGVLLAARGEREEAIACYRKALEIDPRLPPAHANLGGALAAQGKPGEAIPHFRKTVELQPGDARAHYNLGTALIALQEWDQAAACFRKAIELAPANAEAHCNLGHTLFGQGDFTEALGWFRRGHELGSKRPGWHDQYKSEDWVRACERLVEREKELLGVLAGNSQPAGARERLEWAGLCVQTRRYAAAARLSGEAFEADGKLADDLAAGYRYRAARAAALAGAGQGRDAGNLTDEAKATLRRQALDWLKADLAAWRGHGDESRWAQALRSWRADKALAGVRDEPELAKVPPAERAAWGALWADVEDLLKPAR
jgi:tetratricopeptide (TPR) repeat protein